MKLSYFLFAVICGAFMLSSCQEDEEVVSVDKRVEMTFGLDSNFSSSTRAHKSGAYFVWDEKDEVSIFAQGHDNVPGDIFTFSRRLSGQEDLQHQGEFSGTTYDIDKDKYYWALYPYQSDAKLVGNTSSAYVECTIPTQQDAYDNNFDPKACIQVGTASKNSNYIQLENVCAFFYVKVGKGCSGITVTAYKNDFKEIDNDWNMSGKVQVQASSSGASIKQFSGNNKPYVELTNIPEDGGTFYLAFVPSTHGTPALRVSFLGVFSASIDLKASQQFSAGHLYSLGDFTDQYNQSQPEPNNPE